VLIYFERDAPVAENVYELPAWRSPPVNPALVVDKMHRHHVDTVLEAEGEPADLIAGKDCFGILAGEILNERGAARGADFAI